MASKSFPVLLPTVAEGISPDIESILLYGSVVADTSASIGDASSIIAAKKVYNGILKAAQTDWGDIFPITIASNVTKTIIELTGHAVSEAGGTDDDHYGEARIEIDWEAGTVHGLLSYTQGDADEESITEIMDDDISEGTITSTDLDTNGPVVNACTLVLTANTIVALPIYPRPSTEAQCLRYKLTHYKTQDNSGYFAGYTNYPAVDALPTADIEVSTTYRLTTDDDTALASPGVYQYTGTGWICVSCYDTYTLAAWTGDVSVTLIPGVDYEVEVTGNVSSLAIALQTVGVVNIIGDNSSGYDIPTSPTDTYGLGSAVLEDAFEGMASTQTDWALFIQKSGTQLYGVAQKVGT